MNKSNMKRGIKYIAVSIIAVVAVFTVLAMNGCGIMDSSNDVAARNMEQSMQEMQRVVGDVEISEFTEKALTKMIFELRDKSDLVTYAYTKNMEGKYVFEGTCLGYGIPYSVQYTNPETTEWAHAEVVVLPQADPNGLFMPDGLDATWLIMYNEDTDEIEVVYAEPKIMVFQSKRPARMCAEWSLPDNY